MRQGTLFPAPLRKDLTNQRFGKLIALSLSKRDGQGRLIWKCICDCGAVKDVPSRHLVQSMVVSCGCYARSVYGANGKKGAHKISGSKSYLYNPLLTDEDRVRFRGVAEINQWRKAVFERDCYTCDVCKQKGVSLHAHHLEAWAVNKEKRFELSNGITLCKFCHWQFHAFMGGPRKPCAASDYQRYKQIQNLERQS